MRHNDRVACDIHPGSTWVGEDGFACVRNVDAGYVRYTIDGVACTIHHDQFRRQFQSPYDARRVRSQFSMSLAVLAVFHAFWCSASQRFFARSVTRAPNACYSAARGSPAVPQGAVFVGTYSPPATPDVFLEDLNDVLACLATRRSAA